MSSGVEGRKKRAKDCVCCIIISTLGCFFFLYIYTYPARRLIEQFIPTNGPRTRSINICAKVMCCDSTKEVENTIQETERRGENVDAILVELDREYAPKICELVRQRSVEKNDRPIIPTILFIQPDVGDGGGLNEPLSKCLKFGSPGFLNEPVSIEQLVLTLGLILKHYAMVHEVYRSSIARNEGKKYPQFELANVGTEVIPGLSREVLGMQNYNLGHVCKDQQMVSRFAEVCGTI